jgi:ABC-type antimicrobial peptide transport system permease subunit
MNLSLKKSKRTKSGKAWYKFSRNPLSVVGLVIVLFVIFSALLAPWVTPYPAHSVKRWPSHKPTGYTTATTLLKRLT